MHSLPVPPVFKVNSPFYRMVSSFMVAVASSPAVFREDNPMNLQPDQTIELTGVVYPSMSIKPYEIHRNALDGHISLDDFKYSLCMMLTNHAYEAVKDRRTKSPEWEIFRHIRNASSHNNCFTFKPSEPREPAHWRTLTIDHTRKGNNNPLQGQYCFGKFMGIAELLLLLFDIEQTLLIRRAQH